MEDQRRLWLASLRVGKGLKQSEVAEMADIGISTYACYEIGTRTPGGKTALKVAELLDFPMEWFYRDPATIKALPERRVG